MRKIGDAEEFRKNIVVTFTSILGDEKSSSNLEKGIYNYSLDLATKLNVVKKWDNDYFVRIYLDRIRTIYINLKNDDVKNDSNKGN